MDIKQIAYNTTANILSHIVPERALIVARDSLRLFMGTGVGVSKEIAFKTDIPNLPVSFIIGNISGTQAITGNFAQTNTAFTSPRDVSLPSAISFQDGLEIKIADLISTINFTNTLTVHASGSDTINGNSTYVINEAGSIITFISNGINSWNVNTQSNNRVRIDNNQNLTANQQTQARSNISAASMAGLAHANILLNSDINVSQELGDNALVNFGYVVDQWQAGGTGSMAISAQRVADAPPNFDYSLRLTITTPQSSLGSSDQISIFQPLEQIRIKKLGFGTANAKTSRLGGWVKSSVAGNFTVVILNYNETIVEYSYIANLTINSANTWEYKTFNIPAQTAGTWGVATNGIGGFIVFNLAAGSSFQGVAGWQSGDKRTLSGSVNLTATNGATFQITGWAWLAGDDFPSQQDSYLLRPDPDISFSQCQRYYQKSVVNFYNVADVQKYYGVPVFYQTTMRTSPSVSFAGGILSNIMSESVDNVLPYGARYVVLINTGGSVSIGSRTIVLSARL